MAVEAHKHCPMCGKPMPLSETFCSDQCQQQYTVKQKQVQKQRRILYIVIAAFIIIWLFVMFFKKSI